MSATPETPPLREWPGFEHSRRARSALLNYAGVGSVLLALILYFSVTQERFATWDNLINILQSSSILLIVAVGLTFTLLVAGFDISTGGVLALAGVVLAKLVIAGTPVGLAILAVLVGGILFGVVVNGYPIARFGVSFFVVTIATLSLTKGAALVLAEGTTVPLYDNTFLRSVGSDTVAGMPYTVIVALVVLLAAIFVTRYTGFGRMVYAVGGNDEAARLSGIDVVAVRTAAYAICAGAATLAGILEVGRLAAAGPDTNAGIELTAAAAVVLGGTSFLGGAGTMLGTFLGVAFLGVLSNGLILSGVQSWWQGVVAGAVLLASVMLDRLRRGKKSS